ncbi:Magnesium transport protein CorA [Coniochaeta hoffmannii]|uniref:Magnesium transport protein CorA n=1 Tax=Coniochaeta hoffmannii TaxID=91930 RepID=A0AA38SB49_9PEZI|nr:Magnesium transport protein CorA [Coniochaeta hoffmannii]
MDDYMFKSHVQNCRNVAEATSYLEILNYSDPAYNCLEEHPLTDDEFENFLHRRGAFEPPTLQPGVKLLNGIRMVLQQKAKHPETFTPHYISFTAQAYESMVRTLRLPFRAIEGTSVVGPFFWSAYDQDDEDPHLQIIFRKSDVRKKGKTRGWELMLSHSFRTGITTGYAKGTESSDMVGSVKHLKACAAQVMHPLLLPIIILSHDLSTKVDQKQREARDWLRRLEHAVSMRNEIVEAEGYVKQDYMDLDQINRDLVECHSQVLWKRPQAYQEIIDGINTAMTRFWEKASQDPEAYGGRGGEVDRLHRSMLGRLEFYSAKLKGTENYAHTTLERLTIQRAALYNIIAQKESKLNLEMAGQQRRLAHASKRDSNSMKTLSLLGAIFLPATYLASVFSMTFFNFQKDGGGNGNNNNDGPVVAPTLWIYFAITIPLTLIIVISWRVWDKRREKKYEAEDEDLEVGIENMEAKIMSNMRKRTMSKVRTWDTGKAQ